MKKKELITEIMGVPKAVDFWVENMSIILTEIVNHIRQSDDIEEAEAPFKDDDGEIVKEMAYRGFFTLSGIDFNEWMVRIGGYNDLRGLLKDPRFKQLPLYQPEINVTAYFIPERTLNSQGDRDLTQASHGSDIGVKNTVKLGGDNIVFIRQEFEFEFILTVKQIENFDKDKFRKQIKPVISHELTHAYDAFNRIKNGGSSLQGREAFLNAAVKLMSDKSYPQWNEFLHLVYLHLSFEINARITEFYYMVKENKITSYNQFIKALKTSQVWNDVKMLENFNAEQFINSFEVGDRDLFTMLNDVGKNIERVNRNLPPIETMGSPEEGMKHLIDGWDAVLQYLNKVLSSEGYGYKGKLMDMVPEKAKENPEVFFKFFEQRFHKKAEKFKRKLYRISSLLTDRSLMGEGMEEDLNWVNEIGLSEPEQFLFDKFMECKLEKIGSKNWEGWTRYVDKDGKILFVDDINTGTKSPTLWFDHDEIYLKLKEMGLDYEEIRKLCIDMLYDTHKRKVLTAQNHWYVNFV